MSKHPYTCCTQCGHDVLETVSSREFQCRRCGFKHFINPIAAVVGLISNDTGELILIRRARDPGRGKLGLPGGFVDIGETAEEALRREVWEEVDLELGTMTFFVSLPNTYVYQGIAAPVLDLFFTAHVADFSKARAKEEVAGIIVARPESIDLAEVAFESNAEALRRYRARGQ